MLNFILIKEDRQKRLEEIVTNRTERQNKRRQQRKLQTEQFIKSMQMLQANAMLDPSGPFEDYSIFLYRQSAPNFEDRVKDLEKKFTYVPVRIMSVNCINVFGIVSFLLISNFSSILVVTSFV